MTSYHSRMYHLRTNPVHDEWIASSELLRGFASRKDAHRALPPGDCAKCADHQQRTGRVERVPVLSMGR